MIRFGVIGSGKIVEKFIEAAGKVEGFKLTAVYSRTEQRAKEFAAAVGAELIFTDLESMAQSSHIDAVYIASPNSFHAGQAVAFLKQGKHVLCEKALASNSREVREMIAAAEGHKAVLMEAMKTTLTPAFRAVQKHLPEIGEVRRYFAGYCQYSSRYDAFKEGTILNAFNPAYSNGALMDIGVYCLYPLAVLFGRPHSLQANLVMLSSGVDGEGSLILNYGDKEAVVQFSKITDSSLPSEIQGEKGSIIIDKIASPKTIEIHYRDGSTRDISVPMEPNIMVYEIQEFIRLIQQGKLQSKTNSHRNSLTVMEMMDEARRQCGLVFPADGVNKTGI